MKIRIMKYLVVCYLLISYPKADLQAQYFIYEQLDIIDRLLEPPSTNANKIHDHVRQYINGVLVNDTKIEYEFSNGELSSKHVKGSDFKKRFQYKYKDGLLNQIKVSEASVFYSKNITYSKHKFKYNEDRSLREVKVINEDKEGLQEIYNFEYEDGNVTKCIKRIEHNDQEESVVEHLYFDKEKNLVISDLNHLENIVQGTKHLIKDLSFGMAYTKHNKHQDLEEFVIPSDDEKLNYKIVYEYGPYGMWEHMVLKRLDSGFNEHIVLEVSRWYQF